jgi:predicted transcriptional regulator
MMANADRVETPAVRDARLAYERALLDEGRADLDAGRSLTGEGLETWLEAFVGDGELPTPAAIRTASRR